MSAPRSSGSASSRRRLGAELRRLREDANIRIDAAARELECSTAKISRLENGIGPAKAWDVRILLTLYGVTDPEVRERCETWARRTKSASWWEPDADLVSDDIDRYLAAETEAARVRMYCTPVLPVLLQTHDYAVAHIRALQPDWTDDDVQRLAAVRHERQAPLLRSENPLVFEAVIDESAVRRRVGSAEVHADQLDFLVATITNFAAAGRRNLQVRVVPFTAGPGRALSPIAIFEPRDRDLDPVTAHVEDLAGHGSWPDAESLPEVVAIFEQMAGLATDRDDTLRILREAAVAARRATSNERT